MKALGRLKLTQLSKAELDKREMNKISGAAPGECCVCAYNDVNHLANESKGLYSSSLMGTFTYVRP